MKPQASHEPDLAAARGPLRRVGGVLGNRLLAGIAFAIPLLVTYWVLSFGYLLVNGLSEPWLKTLGVNIPGLGFLITLMAFVALGFMAKHVVGRRVLERFEQFLLRVPLVAPIYAGAKQLVNSLRGMSADTHSKRVVAIESFTPGSSLFGFATGSMIDAATGRTLTTVFVPTAPNPTTGIIFAVPAEQVHDCDMSVEEATKMLFSGGLVTPGRPLHFGAPGVRQEGALPRQTGV